MLTYVNIFTVFLSVWLMPTLYLRFNIAFHEVFLLLASTLDLLRIQSEYIHICVSS